MTTENLLQIVKTDNIVYLKEEGCRSSSPDVFSGPHQCPTGSWWQPGPSPSWTGRLVPSPPRRLQKSSAYVSQWTTVALQKTSVTCSRCLDTVHLHQQLCLHSAAGLVFLRRPPAAAHRVDFIDEDCRGSVETCLRRNTAL